MTPELLHEARAEVCGVAERAAALLMEGYRNVQKAQHKSAFDLVTEYDFKSEELIRGELSQRYPQHNLVGEEGGAQGGSTDPNALTWYVDPLDGTINFVHGHPFFAVSIGLCRGGEPLLGVVVAPALGVVWEGAVGLGATRNGQPCRTSACKALDQSLLASGFPQDRAVSSDNNYAEFTQLTSLTRGVRRCGSAALDLALTADGTYDGFWEYKLHAWDVAAGAALVLAAGGKVTGENHGAVDVRQGALVASNGPLHDPLLSALQKARGGRPFPGHPDSLE